MKNVIALVVAFLWLTGCASNETTQAAVSADTASSTADSLPARKKVCTHERSRGGISRMRRVCEYVDVDIDADAI